MIDLRIVLVRPIYPRNIGMVSRIMANYDLSRLILVAPQCELNEEAKQGAARGQGPLSQAKIYPSWKEFSQYEEEGLRIGLSRRQGKRRLSEPLGEILDHSDLGFTARPVYLFFGAEDHGLSTEDLDLCHRLAFFQLPGEVQSMNLSHAVLLTCQLFYQRFAETQTRSEHHPQVGLSDPEPYLREWLETLGLELDSQKRWNALTMLKQLILKASPTPVELNGLEKIVQQTIRLLKESKKQ